MSERCGQRTQLGLSCRNFKLPDEDRCYQHANSDAKRRTRVRRAQEWQAKTQRGVRG